MFSLTKKGGKPMKTFGALMAMLGVMALLAAPVVYTNEDSLVDREIASAALRGNLGGSCTPLSYSLVMPSGDSLLDREMQAAEQRGSGCVQLQSVSPERMNEYLQAN
ncbi:MAG: hypothetical protein Q8R40_04450 [bacterium]|nr:hypothetical protein [bacterium]